MLKKDSCPITSIGMVLGEEEAPEGFEKIKQSFKTDPVTTLCVERAIDKDPITDLCITYNDSTRKSGNTFSVSFLYFCTSAHLTQLLATSD